MYGLRCQPGRGFYLDWITSRIASVSKNKGIVLFLPPIFLINHVGEYTVDGVLRSMQKKDTPFNMNNEEMYVLDFTLSHLGGRYSGGG